jgi:hypothetical protein
MPTFGQDFLQGFTATNNLRDYTHASKVFTTNSWELKPRFKFLFHVVFTINVGQIPALRNSKIFGASEIYNLSLAVKTIDLPKYTISTDTLNQYNRKRVVQTKINYDPVTVTFHDDGGDNIREMWYQYYSYYYKDPAQKYSNVSNTNGSIGAITNSTSNMDYNARDIYEQSRVANVNDWGYIGESYTDGSSAASGKPPFFRDIQIYGFDQHKYARYVLINPLITSWAHDQYDYSQGAGIMQNSMTIAYETVKYYSGGLGKPDANVAWPDSAHYDNTRSALSRPGSTASIFGQGGLLSTGQGIIQDLQSGSVMGLIGAAQKAGTAYNTLKGKNLKSIVQAEATSIGKDIIQGQLPGAVRSVAGKADGWLFPNKTLQRQANTETPPI